LPLPFLLLFSVRVEGIASGTVTVLPAQWLKSKVPVSVPAPEAMPSTRTLIRTRAEKKK
jgi:hypothetical protein